MSRSSLVGIARMLVAVLSGYLVMAGIVGVAVGRSSGPGNWVLIGLGAVGVIIAVASARLMR